MVSNNKILLNDNWKFKALDSENYEEIIIPHTNKEIPYNYFDERDYQIISCYKRNFTVSNSNKRIFLKFDGVMTAFKLFINNNYVNEYKGGYIPHFIEVTDFVHFDKENEIYVEVDSTEREDVPPFGGVVDYLTFGGIYRDVFLYEHNSCFIENIHYDYKVENYLNGTGKVVVSPKVLINSNNKDTNNLITLKIGKEEFEFYTKVKKGSNWYKLNDIQLDNIKLWSLEDPRLYRADMNLFISNEILDSSTMNLGFRKIEVNGTGFYLNGKKIKIMGLNRHQSFPYVGYAMPKRAQIKDADILKDELSINLVRTSHYPQSPYFLDRCDEIGLLVLEEIPGWQHISQREDWRQQVLKDVKGMINRDFNHPSIITWGVRINESLDDDELYSNTNKVARDIDRSRPTCGVRYLEGSSFFEDIYTMNDFSYDGGEIVLRSRDTVTKLEKKVPYLVTEFCGHIYPTKSFDHEQRVVEQALRHGVVQSKSRSSDDYLGAIGWCAFDYNTHFDFGSGDRICYHGVMDMFRQPKYAAYMYKSQKNPKIQAIVEPLTLWSRGERDKGIAFPIYLCTNCEEVEVILGGRSLGIFKRDENTVDENLKYLEYPPIKVDLLNGDWGSNWSEIEFIGYINGEKASSKKFCKNPVVTDLKVVADNNELCGKELDTTRVSVTVVDKYKNKLPYATGAIFLETVGDIDIIGPKVVSLIGGSIAFWVKTKGKFINDRTQVLIKSSFGIEKVVNIKLTESYK